jgi:hypothetical protein
MDLGTPSGPSTPRQRLLIAAVIAAAIVIVAGSIVYSNSRPGADTSPHPSPPSRPTNQPLPTRHASTSPPADPQQWRTHGFLDDLDLDLFARSDTKLYRIRTATQVVIATPTPSQQAGGALTFIVDREQVIVRDWSTPGDGYRVTDGERPQDLPDLLKTPDSILPGPPGHLWVTTYRGEKPTTRLTDLEGRPVRAGEGPSSYPADTFQPDGDHGLILASAGGYYAITPDGPRRLTRGQVLTTGPSAVLTTDCDPTLRCSRYLLDRETGHQRRIGPAPINDNANGAVSRDARYAALWQWTRYGPAELRILDLETGRTRIRLSDPNGAADTGSLLWLPGERLVGILDGRLFVYDAENGNVSKPDLQLDDIQQLRLRTVS